jgi:hypothetical protein
MALAHAVLQAAVRFAVRHRRRRWRWTAAPAMLLMLPLIALKMLVCPADPCSCWSRPMPSWFIQPRLDGLWPAGLPDRVCQGASAPGDSTIGGADLSALVLIVLFDRHDGVALGRLPAGQLDAVSFTRPARTQWSALCHARTRRSCRPLLQFRARKAPACQPAHRLVPAGPAASSPWH